MTLSNVLEIIVLVICPTKLQLEEIKSAIIFFHVIKTK